MSLFRTIGSIFLLVGLCLLGTALYLFESQRRFEHTALRASGTVIDLVLKTHTRSGSGSMSESSTGYSARVAFEARDGSRHEFVDRVSSSPARHRKGQSVGVLYDPAAPGDAVIDERFARFGIVIIMAPLGLLLSLLGGVFVAVPMLQQRRVRRLIAGGDAITTRFQRVYLDEGLSVNGRNPYRVVTQGIHPATGKLQDFVSEPIWVDPSELLQDEPIRVLIDRRRPKLHHVDLSPYVAPEH
jgi:hypothetical protein